MNVSISSTVRGTLVSSSQPISLTYMLSSILAYKTRTNYTVKQMFKNNNKLTPPIPLYFSISSLTKYLALAGSFKADSISFII